MDLKCQDGIVYVEIKLIDVGEEEKISNREVGGNQENRRQGKEGQGRCRTLKGGGKDGTLKEQGRDRTSKRRK